MCFSVFKSKKKQVTPKKSEVPRFIEEPIHIPMTFDGKFISYETVRDNSEKDYMPCHF